MEWKEFQNRAITDVSEGYRSKAPTDQRLVQVLMIPPLDDVISTELFKKQPGGFFVARKIWNRDRDVEKYQTSSSAFRRLRILAPTIETHTTKLEDSSTESLLDLFRQLRLPVWIPDTPATNNSTHYRVTLETALTSVQFQWTAATLEVWSTLNEAAARFVEMVKEQVEQKR